MITNFDERNGKCVVLRTKIIERNETRTNENFRIFRSFGPVSFVRSVPLQAIFEERLNFPVVRSSFEGPLHMLLVSIVQGALRCSNGVGHQMTRTDWLA
jgi:hypothetical protein